MLYLTTIARYAPILVSAVDSASRFSALVKQKTSLRPPQGLDRYTVSTPYGYILLSSNLAHKVFSPRHAFLIEKLRLEEAQ